MSSDYSSNSILKRELYCDGKVARIVLNDPKRRNALSLEMIQALHKELFEIDAIQKVRAVIIAALGPAFSSGHDLKQLRTSEGIEKHKLIFDKCTKMMSLIQNMSLPVIAEVSGIAAAAGCQLVATCDFVVAGRSAKFLTPGIKVGLFCSTPGIALARAVPRKVALDLLLTGDAIDSEQALRAGLVSRVVEDSEVKSEALKIAEKISALSRPVVALGKSFFYTQAQLPTSDAYRMGERVMVDNLQYEDAQEGITAFVEKRVPVWKNTDKKVR